MGSLGFGGGVRRGYLRLMIMMKGGCDEGLGLLIGTISKGHDFLKLERTLILCLESFIEIWGSCIGIGLEIVYCW